MSNKPNSQLPDSVESWFLALREQPENDQLLAEFSHWKSQDPSREAEYLELLLIWDQLELQQELQPGLSDQQSVPVKPPARVFKPRRWLAASLLCSLALLVSFFKPWLQTADYTTPSGEVHSFELADGSKVTLAGGSALNVIFDGQRRQLELLRGEAFFQVASETRPFEVRSASLTTRALGTAFNVRLLEQGVDVLLTEGRVEGLDSGQHQQLEAGQQLASRDRHWQLSNVDAGYWPGWTKGSVRVEKMPLEQLLLLLNRYYAEPITLANPTLGDTQVNGIVPIDNLPLTLAVLKQSLGVEHQRLSQWILLY